MVGRIRIYLLFLSLTPIIFGCFNRNPQAPEWDTTINIPLVHERYPTLDLVDTLNPTIGVQINEDSIMQLYINLGLDSFSVHDSFTIGNVDTTIERDVGDMCITNLDRGEFSISATEIIEEGAGIEMPESTIIVPLIPPFSYKTSEKSDTFHMIDNALLRLAFFTIGIDNYTGMSFDSVIFLPLAGLETGDIAFIDIASNTHSDTSIYLENTHAESEISAQLRFIVSDTLFDVNFSIDDSVRFIVNIDSIKLESGEIKIPSFKDSTSYEIDLPLLTDYSLELDSINFSAGTLKIDFTNNTPIEGRLTVYLEQLDTLFLIPISPYTPSTRGMDLSGITFDNTASPFGSTTLSIELLLEADSTEDFVNITSTDAISTGIKLQTADFSLIGGEIIEPITDHFDYRLEIPIEYEDLNFVKIAKSDIHLDIFNTIGFASGVIGNISGKNPHGDSVGIPFSISVNAGSPYLPPSQGSSCLDMAPLLNILPHEIIVNGVFSLDEGEGVLEKNSFITGRVYNRTEMRLAFTCDTVYFDTTDVQIEEDLLDVLENIQSANLNIWVKNHFPLGFDCDIVVLKEPPEADSFVKSISLPPAPTDANGVAISPVIKTIEISLDSIEFEVLKSPSFSTFALLYVPETDTITIHARDYLEFNAYCAVKLRVEE